LNHVWNKKSHLMAFYLTSSIICLQSSAHLEFPYQGKGCD
jgi:hypothetical protein